MIDKIIHTLSNLPKEFIVFLLSVLPISELRGAIPVGVSFGLSITKVITLSLLGNCSFVIPFLWFLNNLHHHFMKISWYNKFFTWWFSKIKPKTKNIEKYEYIGLALFVGIPLPATGAWSGCVASYLLGLNFWKSVVAIFAGIIIAAIVVTFATFSTTEIVKFVYK